MLDQLKEFARRLNELGIPLPMIRNPETQKASVSLTTVVVSFGVCVIGLFGKASGYFGGVDMSQALTLFGLSASLYFGRKFQDNKSNIVMEVEEKDKKDE